MMRTSEPPHSQPNDSGVALDLTFLRRGRGDAGGNVKCAALVHRGKCRPVAARRIAAARIAHLRGARKSVPGWRLCARVRFRTLDFPDLSRFGRALQPDRRSLYRVPGQCPEPKVRAHYAATRSRSSGSKGALNHRVARVPKFLSESAASADELRNRTIRADTSPNTVYRSCIKRFRVFHPDRGRHTQTYATTAEHAGTAVPGGIAQWVRAERSPRGGGHR